MEAVAKPAKARRLLSRGAFLFVLIVAYALVAGAAFNGYYGKWTLSDGNEAQSLVAMLDGTAKRPYVYRQLLPRVATAATRILPASVVQTMDTRLTAAQGALKPPTGADASKDGYVLRYRIVYYLTFLSLFAGLFVLRGLCLDIGLNRVAATTAPALFALLFPVLQTRGGYFYDYPELLFMALAVKFAYAGRVPLLLLLAAPATANKESFFFFAGSLLPLLTRKVRFMWAAAWTGVIVVICGLTYAAIASLYANNPGSPVIFQLGASLRFYANPLNLLKFENTYGLPLFKGYGAAILGWLGLMMAYGWREIPARLRQHLALAALVNLPLFLLFCAEGEMRNLSMLFVAVVVLIGGAMQRWMRSSGQTPALRGAALTGDPPRSPRTARRSVETAESLS